MNLPFNRIHDLLFSYGRLIIPWFGKDRFGKRRWLAWFFNKGTFFNRGIKRTDEYGFHNCRAKLTALANGEDGWKLKE